MVGFNVKHGQTAAGSDGTASPAELLDAVA